MPCNPDSPKQYGEWLRASGNQKSSVDRPKVSNSWSFEDEQSGRSSGRSVPTMKNPSDSTSKPGASSEVHTNQQNRDSVKPQNSDRKESSRSYAADFAERNSEGSKFKPSQSELLPRDKEGAIGLGIKAMDVVYEVGHSSKSYQEA